MEEDKEGAMEKVWFVVSFGLGLMLAAAVIFAVVLVLRKLRRARELEEFEAGRKWVTLRQQELARAADKTHPEDHRPPQPLPRNASLYLEQKHDSAVDQTTTCHAISGLHEYIDILPDEDGVVESTKTPESRSKHETYQDVRDFDTSDVDYYIEMRPQPLIQSQVVENNHDVSVHVTSPVYDTPYDHVLINKGVQQFQPKAPVAKGPAISPTAVRHLQQEAQKLPDLKEIQLQLKVLKTVPSPEAQKKMKR